jgi:hypothetical protein
MVTSFLISRIFFTVLTRKNHKYPKKRKPNLNVYQAEKTILYYIVLDILVIQNCKLLSFQWQMNNCKYFLAVFKKAWGYSNDDCAGAGMLPIWLPQYLSTTCTVNPLQFLHSYCKEWQCGKLKLLPILRITVMIKIKATPCGKRWTNFMDHSCSDYFTIRYYL